MMTKPMRMYSDYFGIRENAFAITPDPRYLFMSDHHREAMAHLLFGMEEGGGFVQLTGEVGTGKTTICRAFLEELQENVDVALLLNPPDDGRELLLAIISELRLPLPRRNSGVRELVDLLNERLLEAHADGRRTVVIIDEAQNISAAVLEQVRLLTNLETPSHKLLQVFLIGQPELRQKLEQPSLRQVAQRITARYHLEPLSLLQTQGYIQHRLEVAGCMLGLFSPAAIKQVYRESQGIPRAINIICDRALLGAFATDSSEVSAATVRYAAREWRGENARWRPDTAMARMATAMAVAGLTLVAAVGIAANGNMRPDNSIVSMANAGTEAIANLVKRVLPVPDRTLMDGRESQGYRSGVNTEATGAEAKPFAVQMSAPSSVSMPLQNVESFTSGVSANVAVPEPSSVASAEAELVSAQRAVKAGKPIALKALLTSWDIRSDSLNRSALCDKVVSYGLLCLRDHGTWEDLRAYNRPALLSLHGQNEKEAYLALVGMNKESALIATVEGLRNVSYRELEAYWSGEFVLLWRPPFNGLSLIGSGSAEWAVAWLHKALGDIDGSDKTVGADVHNMEQRLRRFQKSHGLTADGIAGPRTLIHLNTLISEQKFPILISAHRNS